VTSMCRTIDVGYWCADNDFGEMFLIIARLRPCKSWHGARVAEWRKRVRGWVCRTQRGSEENRVCIRERGPDPSSTWRLMRYIKAKIDWIWKEVQDIRVGNKAAMDYKTLESYRGFLIYVAQTYTTLVPYLKGIHLTLDSWRPNQDDDGWKITNTLEESLPKPECRG